MGFGWDKSCHCATGVQAYFFADYRNACQKNQTPICTDVSQAYPNTKSKCNCEDVPIPTLVIRKIVVDKVTDPANAPTPFGLTLTGPDVTVAFDLTDDEDPFISGLLARRWPWGRRRR